MAGRIFHFIGRPPSVNREYRKHWRIGADTARTYRGEAWAQANRKEPLEGPVEIHAQPITHDGRRADAGACFFVVKAIVDGFVDAGLLPGDGPDIVKCVHLHAPEMGEDDRLVIEVTQLDP